MKKFKSLPVLFIIMWLLPSCLLPASKQAGLVTYRPPVDRANPVKIHINQVGYTSEMAKQVVVESLQEHPRFQLFSTDNPAAIFEAPLQPVPDFSEWGGGPFFAVADFSKITAAGQYQLQVGNVRSGTFRIGDNAVFDETLSSVLQYFTGSRASDGDVWRNDVAVPIIGTSMTVDARGGWYDASGDISKYLSHLSYGNYFNPQQIPLVAWGLAWTSQALAAKGMDAQLVERAAIEASWGADYLTRILSNEGYFYATVFDRWSGEMADRTICAFRYQSGEMTSAYQAAFREGGGMAIAALARSSLLKRNGVFTSEEYLNAARRGFAHLQKNNLKYVDDGQENILDDYAALMAAQELFRATADLQYLSDARERAGSLVRRLHPEGYFIADNGSRPFWHASDAGLPLIALVLYAEQESDLALRKQAADVIHAHLSYLVKVTRSAANPYGYARQHVAVNGEVLDGFFVPHENETKYWWQGENARLGSLSAAAFIAGQFLKNEGLPALDPSNYAWAQLNWILGANPLDLCFLKGAGAYNPPDYSHSKPQHGDLPGGIANGITGSDKYGKGIDWFEMPERKHDAWDKWRWYEQWLPHSAWFMVAVVAGQPSRIVVSQEIPPQ